MNETTYLGVAQRDQNLRHTLLLGLGLGIAVQDDRRSARLGVVQDLDVLHGRSSALRLDAERLEDGLLAGPASSKRRRGGWLLLAVRHLVLREVALDERRVVRGHGGDEL